MRTANLLAEGGWFGLEEQKQGDWQFAAWRIMPNTKQTRSLFILLRNKELMPAAKDDEKVMLPGRFGHFDFWVEMYPNSDRSDSHWSQAVLLPSTGGLLIAAYRFKSPR